MTLSSRTALMAALLVIGCAAGPIDANADEIPSTGAPARQAPEAGPSHDLEPDATTPSSSKGFHLVGGK